MDGRRLLMTFTLTRIQVIYIFPSSQAPHSLLSHLTLLTNFRFCFGLQVIGI